MQKILFPLLLLVVSTTFAKDAGKAETPEQIVQKLYRVYQEENATDSGVSFDGYVSAEIKALFAKDEKLADGEMGCIDYDFIIQGQDYDAASIKRTLKIKTLDKNTVAATFKNFDEPTTVTYSDTPKVSDKARCRKQYAFVRRGGATHSMGLSVDGYTNSTARRENARLPTYSNQAGKTNRRALSKNPWRIVWRMWKRMAQRNSPLRQAQGSSRVGLAPPFNQILARC